MTQPPAERQPSRPSIGLALLGLGVVGTGVAQSLTAHGEDFERRIGRPLELRHVLVRDSAKARQAPVDGSLIDTSFDRVMNDPDTRIVIEVMGGEDPAYRYLCQTLESGRHVVTANKEVMAKHGTELLSLARRNGVDILFEASVGGGIPLIAPLKRDLAANEISSLRAIVNGTTNYILTRMSRESLDFNEALSAHPRQDVIGGSVDNRA